MIYGHGGNIHELADRLGCNLEEIIDMSSNINPYGPPPGLFDHLKDRLSSIAALPQADGADIVNAFSKQHNVDSSRVMAGNGTTQLIYTIPRALESENVLICGPTYSDYADACIMNKVKFDYFMADESDKFIPDFERLKKEIPGHDTVFICNPNNPTGTLIDKDILIDICQSFPNTVFVIDESYLPFVSNDGAKTVAGADVEIENLIVLNSMSKIFRIPGLRIGFAIVSKSLAPRMKQYSLPWSVNSLAQAAVLYLMEKRAMVLQFITSSNKSIDENKAAFLKKMASLKGIRFFDSATVFILAKIENDELMAEDVCTQLADEKILIRNCTNFSGLGGRFIRISLKFPEINDMLSDRLSNIFK